MSKVMIEIDVATERRLQTLIQTEAEGLAEVASRLLRRAALLARPRHSFDTEAIRIANLEFADQDRAFAEAGSEERFQLLLAEDTA